MDTVRAEIVFGVSVALSLAACQLGIFNFSVTPGKAGLSFLSKDPIRHLALVSDFACLELTFGVAFSIGHPA